VYDNNLKKKKSIPIKQQVTRKRLSVDSKQSLSTTKTPRRKTIILKPSSSTSESDTSDNEIILNNHKIKKQQTTNSKKIISTIKKSDEKKKSTGTVSRSNSAPVKKSKSTTETEHTIKPVIKIAKIPDEFLMESTLPIQKHSKKQTTKTHDNTSTNKAQSNTHSSLSESHNLTPLPVTPVSPSPPPSITDESSSVFSNTQNINIETPSIFQTIMPSTSINNQQIENFFIKFK